VIKVIDDSNATSQKVIDFRSEDYCSTVSKESAESLQGDIQKFTNEIKESGNQDALVLEIDAKELAKKGDINVQFSPRLEK